MRRISSHRPYALLLALFVLAACVKPMPQVVRPLPPPTVVERLPQGATLALARPTPAVAKLALWLEVGSRHADPPQLATAAAWWAATKVGAHARVLPDGTELTLTCNTVRDGIARCVDQLGKALSVADVSDEDALRLRHQLAAARMRARADGARQIDVAAVAALFGEGARGLEPLGREAGDAAITKERIRAFLGQHYAKSRAVLMAAGDVGETDLAQAFARVPDGKRATRAQATRLPSELVVRSSVSVMEGDSALVGFALATPTAADAIAIGHRFREIHTSAEAHVSPLRGASVLHVHMPLGAEPWKRLQSAVFDLRRLALEGSSATVAARADESLEGLLSELGQSWAARGSRARELSLPWPLGVAVTMPNALPPESAESKKKLERWKQDAEVAVSLAETVAEGRVRGDIESWGAQVESANGARIEIQRRPGERWFAASIRFEGGSALDPSTRHGRAALLATLMSEGCGFAAGPALDARLTSLDARIVPLVSSDGLGIAITAPSERSEAALDVMLRCAIRPALTQRGLEDARVRLLGELRTQPDALFAAYLGRALAPSAPGHVAPWGTPFGVAAVSLGEVRRLHAELLRGARIRVHVAADGEPEELSRFVARRLGHLEPGERTSPPPDPDAPVALNGELTEVPSLHVVIGLRTPANTRSLLAPSVLARAWLEGLSARLGRPAWSWGDSSERVAAAGVALAVTEDELTRIELATREVLKDLGARSDQRWRAALEDAQTRRAAEWSSSLGWARTGFDGASGASTAIADEIAILRRLVLETPAYFVLRPRP